MADLIKILKSFNRKERPFLLSRVTGQRSDDGEPKFELCEEFRKELIDKLDLKVRLEDMEDAFVAMDYHLNWIHASLALARGVQNVTRDLVEQSPEDIDLLVAFQDADYKYHLIFLDAKGYSRNPSKCSTKSQMFEHFKLGETGGKIDRLKQILNDQKGNDIRVIPYFVLVSGYKQKNLDSFPSLASKIGQKKCVKWLDLNLPTKRRLVKFPKDGPRIDHVKLRM